MPLLFPVAHRGQNCSALFCSPWRPQRTLSAPRRPL